MRGDLLHSQIVVMRVETSRLAEMATDTFSIEAIVRGYHGKQDSWGALHSPFNH